LTEKEKKKEKKEQKPTVFMNFEWFLFSSDIMEVWD